MIAKLPLYYWQSTKIYTRKEEVCTVSVASACILEYSSQMSKGKGALQSRIRARGLKSSDERIQWFFNILFCCICQKYCQKKYTYEYV